MKKLLIVALAALATNNVFAQISITTGAGLTHTQNFNTLDTLAAGSNVMPAGWAFKKEGTSATATNGLYGSTNGGTNAGNIYSVGSSGSTERAFGSLASAAVRSTIGATFVNNTGATITSLTVSAKAEQWRKGDNFMVPDTAFCSISTVATVIDSTLPGWVATPSLNLLSTLTDSLIPNGAIDGNAIGNFTNINGVITLNIAPGGTFAIRWWDPNAQGSDDILGLDDVVMTFATGIAPPPVAPIISTLVPADNATNVAITTPITVNFSQNVVAGAGPIVLTNITDGTFQTFTVPSAAVSVVGQTVNITGATLAYGKDYAIGIDSNCFNNAGVKFAGIYNTTTWNFTTASGPLQPLISFLTPADNALNVPITTPLSVTFSQPISVGTGNIDIQNLTDGTNLLIPVTGAQVNVTGATANITGVVFLNSKDYSIRMDSTCFNNGGTKIKGIYNDTTWNFKTIAVVPPATSLNETFTNCLAPLLGGFVQYSKVGGQNWRCSKFGRTDTNAVSVNGFSGGNLANEDYLISPPLNLTSFTAPYVHFWSKVRFPAATTKEFLISNNYLGGDPTLATWTPLITSLPGLDSNYKSFGSFNLTPYKGTTAHLAFKYVSTTAAADEWSIDDVNITEGIPTNIQSIVLNSNEFAVMGNATDGNLQILLDSKNPDNFTLNVMDLNGKAIFNTNVKTNTGINKMQIALPNITNGLYIIKIQNKNVSGIIKFTKL
jgi:trimeric autotransporter adhesin